jgi:cell division protein FtsX
VLLFNAATTATVLLGVVSLYVALLVLALAGAGLVVTPDALSRALGRTVGLSDYLELAWFVSSLATVGGALGAGLESDEAVREAAYAYRRTDERPAR